MNKKIVILLLTAVHCSIAHAQFHDSFSDGDFTINPIWMGSKEHFVIQDEQLKLNAPAESASAYLATASRSIKKAQWDFYVKMEFNPSSGNLARVYLTSDHVDLSGDLNGYYIQLGGVDDDISLYRQSGSTRVKIIDGQNDLLNLTVAEVRVRVTTDEDGKWELFADVGLSNSFSKQGEVTDRTHPSSAFFGVFCLFTATRSDKFHFDDFIVSGDASTPSPPAFRKDVIMTEIYPDPSESNGLPQAEFLEVLNRTERPIILDGWSIADPGSSGELTGIIQPGEYLIIASNSSKSDFDSFGKVMGISGFPSLNNSGDVLVLKDTDGQTIDSVNYTSVWYGDSDKKSGGWSLELIDPENPCGEGDNWKASENPAGGTPGKQNSVYANKPDLTAPILVGVVPQDDLRLNLIFNEKLNLELPAAIDFQITPAVEVASVKFGNVALTKLILELKGSLQPSTRYTLHLSGIRDCSGNSTDVEQAFGLPGEPGALDVVINEILFNPRPTGVDFVELYNPTNLYFNLKNWRLGNLKEEHPENLKVITTKDLLFGPGEFVVVTIDIETIVSHYPLSVRKNLLNSQLPSLPDDTGSLVLIDSTGQVIDGFVYSDNMHSVFIKDDDGVSLERITSDGPTQNPENWKSASATSGFATPGYLNSNNSLRTVSTLGDVSINPEIFIPVTGHPDFTEIRYKFSKGGYLANIKILNSRGIVIREIASNSTLGTEGFFRWEGDQDNGSKTRIGYYIVWFQISGVEGDTEVFQKRVIVATQF